jgi:hypothetical protein
VVEITPFGAQAEIHETQIWTATSAGATMSSNVSTMARKHMEYERRKAQRAQAAGYAPHDPRRLTPKQRSEYLDKLVRATDGLKAPK